jgi:signal transduction histidine kinase
MQQVADAARHSLWEMRRLLDVLRDDASPARRPQPGVDGLEQLLEDVRATGLAVRLERTGEPDGMGPAVEATLFRIVQESLTNVLTHARDASAVLVQLRFEPEAVRFSVQDDGRPDVVDAAERSAPGRGLVGMRERVAMFGGTLEVSPSPDGWRIAGELRLG